MWYILISFNHYSLKGPLTKEEILPYVRKVITLEELAKKILDIIKSSDEKTIHQEKIATKLDEDEIHSTPTEIFLALMMIYEKEDILEILVEVPGNTFGVTFSKKDK